MTEGNTAVAFKLAEIHDSPFNRKTFHKDTIRQLADTIGEVGLLQQPIVRMVQKGDKEVPECVCGHRRRKAFELLGYEQITCTVRQLTDEQARLVQAIENAQREDVHPLEEGDAFWELHKEHDLSVEVIAAKIGKSKPHIYKRLSLAHLCDKARELFMAGKFGIGIAEVVAQVMDPTQQARAAVEMARPPQHWHDREWTVTRAREWVKSAYMLVLKEAQFDIKDQQLIPDVGACYSCPKRTGANADLFGDLGKDDLCTDGKCYGRKADAGWRARVKLAKANENIKVATKAQANEIFPYPHSTTISHDSGLVDLGKESWHYGHKTPKQVLKQAGVKLPVTLARDRDGRARELVKKADVEKALKGINRKDPQQQQQATASTSKKDKQARAKEKLEDAIYARAKQIQADQLVNAAVASRLSDVEFWKTMATLAVLGCWTDTARVVCRRRNLVVEKGKRPEDALQALISQQTSVRQLLALTVEILAKPAHPNGSCWETALKHYGIDKKQARKEAAKQIKDEAKEKEAAKKAKQKVKAS